MKRMRKFPPNWRDCAIVPKAIGSHISVGRKFDPVFIIAEIGQNHQGSIEIAKQLIYEAKRIGCDCVKFQKSCLSEKFTKSALDRQYNGENSWGKTYGDHKKFLEFSEEEFFELKEFSENLNIIFSASAMDEVSLRQLEKMKLPFIKIGSGDANNFPLLKIAATFSCPLIISTGMQTIATITDIVKIMKNAGKQNYSLLHCVSSYPTEPEFCNLQVIPLLRAMFPEVVIGYSGHEIGINISEAATLLGAKIIERHLTLNTEQKGSDHKCSLTPMQFELFIKRIRRFEEKKYFIKEYGNDEILRLLENDKNVREALKPITKSVIQPCELACKQKLGKSLVCAKNLVKGSILQENDIKIKVSEPSGIAAEYLENCLGMILQRDFREDFPLEIDNTFIDF